MSTADQEPQRRAHDGDGAGADRGRVWLGIAGFYAASFAVLGLYMQFFPAWLHDVQRFDERQIAVVLSAQTLSRTLAGPLISQRVDRRGRVRRVLLLLSLGAAGAFALYPLAHSVAVAWCVSFGFGCLFPPMLPIVDAAAVGAGARAGFSFGRLRTVGSLSFLVTILVAGGVLDAAGTAWLFPMLLAALLLTSAAAGAMAGDAEPPPARETAVAERAPLRELLTSPSFLLLLVASSLIQGSHATFYNLSTVHWQAHGIGKSTAALLWAEGVLAEIVLLFFAQRLLGRLRPTTLMLLGAAGAVVRWTVIGASTSLLVLFAVNWLHALSFAATYLGAIRSIERRLPARMRTTAQGLVGAANSGFGMVVCGLAGGYAYQAWQGRAFWLMAGVALVGGGCAFALRLRRDEPSQ